MAQITIRTVFHHARPSRSISPSAFFEQTRAYRPGQPIRNTCCLQAKPRNLAPSLITRPQNLPFHVKSLPVRRLFSISASPRATIVRLNPRKDDDGNDMTIEISERAAKRLKKITNSPPARNTLISSPASKDSHLRITVTSGGCHGFQYLLSLEEPSKIDQEEDTLFIPSADEASDAPGRAEVVLDSASLELLKGSTVDFIEDLMGSRFEIVGNPRAKSSCGCGTSFDIA